MRIPTATYRIQFHHGFTFNHLAELVDYLEDLGITAVYGSPILAAIKGSEHGYDGIDPWQLNPEIGTIEELRAVAKQLQQKGIGWIQDIVPNHLAFHTDNPWIFDVLERGRYSPYANYFDIDWEHPAYVNKLMVPFLEKGLEECIREQKVRLHYSASGFSLAYADYSFPLRTESYSFLLADCLGDDFKEIGGLINTMELRKDCAQEEWASAKKVLLDLLNSPQLLPRITKKAEQINNDDQLLLQLAGMQHYVLCVYSLTDQQINYRRFFNINALISLRMENEQVFREYHRFIYELYNEGIFTGLRIDHIDGLKDPGEYIDRLRQLFGNDCYIIIEKILDFKEQLPPLDIQGTSGYEFLSYINQLVTDKASAGRLLSLYRQYVPDERDYHRIVFDNKLANLQHSLNGDWDNLLRLLLSPGLLEETVQPGQIKEALGAFMAAYPVYRAYITSYPFAESDTKMINEAFETARQYAPHTSAALNVLQRVFTQSDDEAVNVRRLAFIQRLMQFTGPMTAKGVEDTTFYQYNVLISQNEVGDSPCLLGITVDEFHKKMQERIGHNANSLNSTSTHDTKRGEDARIRINLISELIDKWSNLVAQCHQFAEPLRRQVNDILAPVANDEYLLYQALTGSLPQDLVITEEFISRTKNYFIKALRESKLITNHTQPNDAYEKACLEFIDRLFDPAQPFLELLIPYVKELLPYSSVYSLVQVIIKITTPGIPDIYRGSELWDLSYVDPDNRRPVDYDLRKKLMQELQQLDEADHYKRIEWAKANAEAGAQKLWVTRMLLRLRKNKPALFSKGDYIPVHVESGERRVIAYLRQDGDDWLLVILPLGIVADTGKPLAIKLPADAPSKWENLFTGETTEGRTIDVHSLYKNFPVAVLQPL